MSASKLTDSDKQEIINIYQDVPEETTITLADRFGVSSSTVRRVLQAAIPKDVYDVLTQQKQKLHRTGKKSSRNAADEPDEILETVTTHQLPLQLSDNDDSDPAAAAEDNEETKSDKSSPISITKRRRRSSAEDSDSSPPAPVTVSQAVPSDEPKEEQLEEFSEMDDDDVSEIPEFISEEFDGFDDEDDYLEEEEEEDEGSTIPEPILAPRRDQIKILPLTDASLPRMCYVVTDRMGELVVRPLKAFSELGRIPASEVQEKTLPVFDNHRVASRFSARNQRVLKIPDGKLLRRTALHLQNKGITRLLIDGQVYRL
ncbi:MAG: transcriptional regulator [Microcoleaceae cyanobacterium]